MEEGTYGVTGPWVTRREVILCQLEKVLLVASAWTSMRSFARMTSIGPMVAALGGTLEMSPDWPNVPFSEFCMMVIPPKAYSCREPKGHFGEEVAFFYSGEEVQLEIDGDSYTLHHEDSIRIPGGAMHRWYNPTDETVQVIFAVSPPSF